MSALDKFGKIIIHNVRDETIDDWEMMLDGRMKGELADSVRLLADRFTPDQLQSLRRLVAMVVDTSLYHLLHMIDETNEITVTIRGQDGSVGEPKEMSDGLAGELYSNDGWIARFSKFGPKD